MDKPAQSANLELLMRALQRQAPAVLTCGEGLLHCEIMIEFYPPAKEPDAAGFYATIQEKHVHFVDDLVLRASSVGFWFQHEQSMILFNSRVLKTRRRVIGQHLIQIAWPEEINAVEERHQPRCLVPESAKISAAIQVLSPARDIELEAAAQIWDLGRDGASVICDAERLLIALPKDSWLNVVIRAREQKPFTMTASFRHMRPFSQDKVRIGLQFLPSGDPSAESATAALSDLLRELHPTPATTAARIPPANAA